jgi:hypothetical protein
MSSERLRILVGGFLGLLPVGSVTWDYIQYPLGLLEMGHDAYYIEDSRLYPIYQLDGDGVSCAATVAYLSRVMDAHVATHCSQIKKERQTLTIKR